MSTVLPTVHLGAVDYAIIGVYFIFVLGVGWGLRRQTKTSSDFFLSGRSLPAWVTGIAFISANLGAQEVIGMGASGAKYGIATSHFYWVGAIPAMVFVGLFMMPFYYGSRARSVPEYLRLRFDEKTRGLNAITFAVMTIFSSGISLYAMGKLFNLLLGWSFSFSIWVSAIVVLGYIVLGGLTSAIYNEVMQFVLIVFGFLPLAIIGYLAAGGWHGLSTRLAELSVSHGLPAGAFSHAWKYMGSAAENPIGVEWFGLVMGLGFVLSFGYWTTDFLVVQRALAAESMTAARRTPLIAAMPKMLFPFLVILPGMIAVALMAMPSKGYRIPAPILDNAVYARAEAAVAAGAREPADQAFREVSAAVGERMDPEKVALLVSDYAAKPLEAAPFRDRLWNAVAEYDYDGLVTTTGRSFQVSNIQVSRVRDGQIVTSRDYHNHPVLADAAAQRLD